MRVAGSLWSVPPAKVRSEASRLVTAGLGVWHWDRADGSLGPAGGFTARDAHEITASTGARSEAHLMLADPRPELDDWLAFSELVIVHVESTYWRESVDHIRTSGARAGIAIGPDSELPQGLDADLAVLIMTVAPGNAGTGFRTDRLPLLELARRQPLRGVDGSVDGERSRSARAHGANWVVSGTALTTAKDPSAWLNALRSLPSRVSETDG
ncbi:hypothetical protein ACI3KS_04090 [Microbacterium sp. ZW T5_45]|uniref:hypothetical protein n=1 Tax=Microbacterium sp. ZW T5_45 TaxID=3378080 RepID=UPI00385550C4